jgi:carbonic anhydrase
MQTREASLMKLMNMRSIWNSLTLVLCFVALPVLSRGQAATPEHWGYDGRVDPKHWSKLNPEYALCGTGHIQSPINITNAKVEDLPPLQFNYNAVPLSIVDNGHTVMVNYAPGSTMTVGDKTYTLKQFHFHHPSENHIQGKKYDLEAHLVHADADGHNAVVAILFKIGDTPSPLLDTLWKNISPEKEKVVEVPSISIDVKDLLPSSTGYYTYAGSLTTPPCTEGVTWYVFKTPVSISKAQVEAFAKLYKHDNRFIEPTNQRDIRESQ